MLQNVIKTWKPRKNRKDTEITVQKQCIFRKILYWSLGKMLKIVDVHQKSWNLNGKNSKYTRRTHQNYIQNWFRSDQNDWNSSKTWKIHQKTSTKFPSAISNARKRDQNVKNTKKSKRYISTGPKAVYFSKNPVLEPTKTARNRRFPLKIVKFAD